MEQSSDNKMIPMTSVNSGNLTEVTEDVAYYTNQIVNIIMIGKPGGNWVLVDAGMPKSAEEIIKITQQRFGHQNPPLCIILTHGHFDHVGSIVDLVKKWNVPVYAHPIEFPFLTGEQAYPEPDTSVEGGMLAKLSFLYPHEPIDISEVLKNLPPDNSVPFLTDWKWIGIPGHTPGQIALFREKDRFLIAADAFITVKQDSMYKVLFQKEEVCGPPVYFTPDWESAYDSVIKLSHLNPQTVISGHGKAMEGKELRDGLQYLITNWHKIAVPEHGKWV